MNMWNFVKEKWLTLLLSVFLGWMLWLYANHAESRDDHLDAIFEIRQPGGNLQISVEPEIRRVRLTIQGPTGAIYEATRSDRDVRVVYEAKSPENMADGKLHDIALDRSMVQHLPPDVEVIQFVPATIEVVVHRIMEKPLSVAAPETVGEPEDGYEVYRREIVRPKEVLVTGPQSLLDKLTEVKPEPVDVSGLNEDFRDTQRRIVRKYTVDGISGQVTSRSFVEVFIGIRRKAERRTISGVQIEIAQPETRPPARPLDIEIVSPANPLDLEVEGAPGALDQIKPESIRAFIYIDTGSRKPEDSTPFYQPLVVWGLPPGVKPVKEIVVTARIRPGTGPRPGTEVPKP